MRKSIFALAASITLVGVLHGPVSAETGAYTILPEPPNGSVASYLAKTEDSETEQKSLPSNPLSLAYWEATRDRIALSGKTGKDVLTIARSQIGYREDSNNRFDDPDDGIKFYTRYGDWFGWRYSYWCDMFVSFCVFYAGMEEYPFEVSCARHEKALKSAGYWRDWNSYIPESGDIVFLNFGDKQTGVSHVGIVETILPASENEPARLLTIEGNVFDETKEANCVMRMTRSFDEVVGYGTYTKGEILEEKLSYRNDVSPLAGRVQSKPSWEVLTFIGADDTNYARLYFPEKFADPAQ